MLKSPEKDDVVYRTPVRKNVSPEVIVLWFIYQERTELYPWK